MRRFGPTLLLALPFLVALVPEAVDSTRTIDVTVSRSAFSPERIEVRVGERIRLNVVSVDGTHGFQAKALGLNATIPASGRTVTFELTPREVGTFAINCSEYCGRGHRSMQASLIVTPQIAIEKRAGGHLFQLNVNNGQGTTFGQLARGGFSDSLYLGFNLARKFF